MIECAICEAELQEGEYCYEGDCEYICEDCLKEHLCSLVNRHMDIEVFECRVVPADIDECEIAHALKEDRMMEEYI